MKKLILFLIMTISASCAGGQSNNNFDDFFVMFMNDCVFQSSHVVDSVLLIQYNGDGRTENEQMDTIEFYQKSWQCIDFHLYENIKEEVSERTAVIRSRIEDTGVVLSFYFVLVDEKWCLCRIIDYSM